MNIKQILHYIALILGFQASAFFVFFLIAEGTAGLFEGKTSVISILLLMIFTVAGYVWAITRSRPGGLVMITGGFLMAIYLILLGGLGEIKMSLIYGLPFIIPGIIFYFIAYHNNNSSLE